MWPPQMPPCGAKGGDWEGDSEPAGVADASAGPPDPAGPTGETGETPHPPLTRTEPRQDKGIKCWTESVTY